MQQVRATYKARDSWWTVLLVDPVAGRLVRIAAGRSWLTPNRLTATAFLLGLVAAAAFLTGSPAWLVVGAVLYHVSFVIDCLDGKLARLDGSGSVFGGWLDFFLDRLRVVVCTVALFAGQFWQTERPVFLFAAIAVVFLALFGYVNGAETDKARAQLPAGPTSGGREPAAEAALPGAAGRIRAALHRHRIRMNLVSGVEFEMALVVLGPLLVAAAGPSALLWLTAVAGGLLIAFEVALIGRFWLATRRAGTAPAPAPAHAPASVSGQSAQAPAQPGPDDRATSQARTQPTP